MSIIKYDMARLAGFDRFDLVNAAKSFDKLQDYFDKLTEVAAKSISYLRSYNPDVVVFSEEAGKEFVAELEETRCLLNLLGMASPVAGLLKNMEDTVSLKKPGILADLFLQFRAEMEILTKVITAARLPDDEVLPILAQVEEKPIILAVDDNPEILTVINSVLGNKYRIVAMTDGKLAVKALELYSPVLFLFDSEMPIFSGYELAQEIRAQPHFKKTPILFLTVKGDRECVLNAKKCGADDYILKPVNKKLLLDKVEWHLARTMAMTM